MDATELHKDCIAIDGLEISRRSRSLFEDMRKGGLTRVNCTCALGEGVSGTMDNIACWKRWFGEISNIILRVYSTEDIRRAKRDDKTRPSAAFSSGR